MVDRNNESVISVTQRDVLLRRQRRNSVEQIAPFLSAVLHCVRLIRCTVVAQEVDVLGIVLRPPDYVRWVIAQVDANDN